MAITRQRLGGGSAPTGDQPAIGEADRPQARRRCRAPGADRVPVAEVAIRAWTMPTIALSEAELVSPEGGVETLCSRGASGSITFEAVDRILGGLAAPAGRSRRSTPASHGALRRDSRRSRGPIRSSVPVDAAAEDHRVMLGHVAHRRGLRRSTWWPSFVSLAAIAAPISALEPCLEATVTRTFMIRVSRPSRPRRRGVVWQPCRGMPMVSRPHVCSNGQTSLVQVPLGSLNRCLRPELGRTATPPGRIGRAQTHHSTRTVIAMTSFWAFPLLPSCPLPLFLFCRLCPLPSLLLAMRRTSSTRCPACSPRSRWWRASSSIGPPTAARGWSWRPAWRSRRRGTGPGCVLDRVYGIEPFPSVADVFYLGGMGLVALAVLWLVRGRVPGGDRAGLLDALIVAVGVGLLSWIFLMAPIVADPASRWARSRWRSPTRCSTSCCSACWSGSPAPGVQPCRCAADRRWSPSSWPTSRTRSWRSTAATRPGTSSTRAGWLGACSGGRPPSTPRCAASPTRSRRASADQFSPCACCCWPAPPLMAPAVLVYPGVNGQPIDVPVIATGCVVLFLLVIARLGGVVRRPALDPRRSGSVLEA